MAYYSGQVASFNELLTALVNACVTENWNWVNGILSKNTIYIQPEISTSIVETKGPGLFLHAGTGRNGLNLANKSPMSVRIGDFASSGGKIPNIVFPLDYQIFIFNDPDEVYLIIKYSIDRYMHLAFGGYGSILPVYIDGSIGAGYTQRTTENDRKGIHINATDGGQSLWYVNSVFAGFMHQTLRNTIETVTTGVYCNTTEYSGWNRVGSQIDFINSIKNLYPLLSRDPSAWSSASLLLPIQIVARQPSNKVSILAEVKNARYIRLLNYEPEQIISLGDERWKIFPFHKKNSAVPNGSDLESSPIDHTGTFGWAIRYDGP